MFERAGMPAQAGDLIDVDALINAYYELEPDPSVPEQRVSFGTSGHRGSPFDTAFNEGHIVAITQAIIEYRRRMGYTGKLFIGRDSHAASEPAHRTALEVLVANEVHVWVDSRGSYVPTPAISLAILQANGAPGEVRQQGDGLADGIVITPSHNPPRDGGFKYNPPTGGPADTDATSWIAQRANEILRTGWRNVPRSTQIEGSEFVHKHDYLTEYVDALPTVIDLEAIRRSGVRIGADPLGGASVNYWGMIADRHNLNLTVVNSKVDPRFGFMTLDWDGKIRMDCSSPHAMNSLLGLMTPDAYGHTPYDIATGNDTDSDRHGIVTPAGLMNPNHYLAVAIEYLYQHRGGWHSEMGVGKTLVSSSLIDRVVAGMGRKLVEVPVGFKYFVPGLLSGTLGFGGEESAGASFQRLDGSVWTTDKDGIILSLLASEITAVTGKNPAQLHLEQVERFGQSSYTRVEAPASKQEKERLKNLSSEAVQARELAGQPILAKLTHAPGNDAPIGGLKVVTKDAWFAARPSGTEDIYKIYAESFLGPEHLNEVVESAKQVVSQALAD